MASYSPKNIVWEPWQDPTQRPYITIESLSKSYSGGTILQHVNLEIYKKEFFSILGPSGCGKTTLLRMLAGFEFPDAGDIHIDGLSIIRIPAYERPVNMMFQSYALFPHMTVEDNVAFGLKQEGCPKEEVYDRVAHMLKLVRLQGLANRKPHQLSGGQRQRVALARCLVKKPKLLLLDEPLAALDRKLREETQFELVNIQEEVGITFVMVTHDQEEAMTMSTRVAVMEEGSIRQIGTPHEVYEFPNSRYVADFFGEVNLIEGVVLECVDGIARITCPELNCEIHMTASGVLPTGAQIAAGVRPEKIMMTKVPPIKEGLKTHNCVKGTVYEIQYLGDVSVYHVLLSSGKKLLATVPNLVRMSERPITWDDEVYLFWSPDSGVLLTS